MELGHLLTRSGLTYPEVSSKVCHDFFCQLKNSLSLPWVIYYGAFYLHVVSSFSCIPVICLKLVLFLIPLQFVHLFCNQSKCILLFFSRRHLKKICPASSHETCQWLKFSPNGLRAQSRVSPVVGLLPSACGPACLGMAFPPFLMKQLYRCDSVVISSFVRTGYTTRKWGWLLGRIGYSTTHHYPLYPGIWINVTKCGSVSRLKHSGTQIPVADLIFIILDAELRDAVMSVLESDLASVSFASVSLDKTRNSTGPCLLGLRSCIYAEAVQVVQP